jgi:1-aminocyclopropane-1-carboxylate deaminase/D-cysteine desulfhydrase-like pyridoxal-dependent ACC family enzyme
MVATSRLFWSGETMEFLLDALHWERLDLGASDTPLQRLDGLRASLGDGAPRLWMKRDDLMARAGGGNKLRKLEYLLAEARARGASAVGSIGGPTSNHLRLTCGVGSWLGMRSFAFVTGSAAPSQGGNLHLLELIGARCIEVPDQGSVRGSGEWARARFDEECAREGLVGYWITFGGAGLVGDRGYVRMAAELASQLRGLSVEPSAIHVAVGTGGTMAGLAAGCAATLPQVEVVGWAVSPKGAQVFAGLPSVKAQIAGVLDGLRATGTTIGDSRFRLEHTQVGAGYARPTSAADEAIRLLARSEALFVDPVYTGKALAGLIAEIRAGRYHRDDDVVFVHTGGFPGLFFNAG